MCETTNIKTALALLEEMDAIEIEHLNVLIQAKLALRQEDEKESDPCQLNFL